MNTGYIRMNSNMMRTTSTKLGIYKMFMKRDRTSPDVALEALYHHIHRQLGIYIHTHPAPDVCPNRGHLHRLYAPRKQPAHSGKQIFPLNHSHLPAVLQEHINAHCNRQDIPMISLADQ